MSPPHPPTDRQSVSEYLENFALHGREIAYVQFRGYRTVRWSYEKVAQVSYQVARELRARGIAKGDRVILWGQNCAEWVAAFLACTLLGAPVVPMDEAAAPGFAERVQRQVGACLAVCARKHATRLTNVQSLVLEDLAGIAGDREDTPCSPAVLGKEDPLEIIFTSGTTGDPKGVVITHGNVLANVGPLEREIRRYARYERLVHPLRFLNLLPLSHVFGQFLGIFLPHWMGGTVIFQESLAPAEVERTLRRHRVSVLVAVPRMLESLRQVLERELLEAEGEERFAERYRRAEGKHFLRRWWIFRRAHRALGWKFWAFISGGASLERSTEEFWARLGYAVIQGYGLTETTSLISLNHPFRIGRGSVGKVLPGRELKLAPDGEILVRGEGLAKSYWSGLELRPVSGQDGWFGTGDVGALDAEGNLYFKGRKKDVIVTSAGMNIYPEDLEAALRSQPEIRDCVVVPLEEGGNAQPFAVIIPSLGADAAKAVDLANQSLAEYQKVRHWTVWPESDFPRTATQKPRRGEIAREATHRLGLSVEPAQGPLAELISRVTGRPAPAARPEARLDSDLNLSSLERVELMGALEERYQVDLNETGFSAAKTVGELEQLLRQGSPVQKKFHYPEWTLAWPARWVRIVVQYCLVMPAVFALGWPRREGRERLNGTRGPVLVICNHISGVDVGFVQAALPARLRRRLATAAGGEAMEALRTPDPDRSFFGRVYERAQWVLGAALLNLFPLPRQSGFRESFAYAGRAVDRGYSILVFPEGRHTSDGAIGPFREGIVLLARNLGIPVVPMRIDGLFEQKQAGKKMARPGQIRVKIGEPTMIANSGDAGQIAERLRQTVKCL